MSKNGRLRKAKRRAKADRQARVAGRSTPSMKKVAVSLDADAFRRVRVAERILEHVAKSADIKGAVFISDGELYAKAAGGSETPITGPEVAAFAKRRVLEGSIVDLERVGGGYSFRVLARRSATGVARNRTQPNLSGRLPSTPIPAATVLMSACLKSVAEGASKHSDIRLGVAKETGLLSGTFDVRDPAYDRAIAMTLDSLLKAKLVERDGKAIRLTDAGAERLGEGRAFDQIEVNAKLSELPRRQSSSGGPTYSPKMVDRMLVAVPKMPPDRLMQCWRNMTAILGDPLRAPLHRDAKRIAAAVEDAWSRIDYAADTDFVWPTTDTGRSRGGSVLPDLQGEGMLSYLEYRVGKTADYTTPHRQSILERVFEGKLPSVFDPTYMEGWGRPGSARRLQKMAESIAAFTRNAKRRDEDRMDEAIRQWEQDLGWLHDRYYVGRFGFGWPTTLIGGEPIPLMRP